MSANPASARFHVAMACLSHPTSVLAIVLLILNDHVLKQAFPSWLTGKLSDFAGLYFFDFAVLTGLFAASTAVGWIVHRADGEGSLPFFDHHKGTEKAGRHVSDLAGSAWWASFAGNGVPVVTILAFSGLKTSPVLASTACEILGSVTQMPISMVADPTDLIALPMVGLSWLMWQHQVRLYDDGVGGVSVGVVRSSVRRGGKIAVLMTACLAIVATSRMQVPGVVDVSEDPSNERIVYATTRYPAYRTSPVDQRSKGGSDTHLFRSDNGGATWSVVGESVDRVLVLPAASPDRLLLVDGDAVLLEGASGARRAVYRLHDDVVPNAGTTLKPEQRVALAGTDATDSAVDVDDPTPTPNGTAPITGGAIARGTPRLPILFAGSGNRHIFIGGDTPAFSSDFGRTWSTTVLQGYAPITAMTCSSTKPDVCFAGGKALLKSSDGGLTWSPVGSGTPARGLAIDPTNESVLLKATPNTLERSTDGGLTWAIVCGPNDPTPDSAYTYFKGALDFSTISFHPGRPGMAYAVDARGSLLESGDAGHSWSTILRADVLSVAVGGVRGGGVFVAVGEGGLLRLRPFPLPDRERWQQVNFGMLDTGSFMWAPSPLVPMYEATYVGGIALALIVVVWLGVLGIRRRLLRPVSIWLLAGWAMVPVLIVFLGLVGWRLSKPAELLLVLAWPFMLFVGWIVDGRRWLLGELGLLIILAFVIAPQVFDSAMLAFPLGVVLFAGSILAGWVESFPWLAIPVWLGGAFLLWRRWPYGRPRLVLAAIAASGLLWLLLAFGFPYAFI